jgi:FecR protein
MRLSRKVFAFAGAVALTAGGYAAAQSAAVGVAAVVVKDVKLSSLQVPKAKPVVVKQRIALGDLIQTGKGSQLQLLLLDRSSFSIGANAFVYDPVRGRNSGATVTKGAFRFMSGQPNKSNRGSISSPVATIGIRGTIIEGVVGEGALDIAKGESKELKNTKADKKTATLIVLRGPGRGTAPGAEIGAASVTSGGVTVELTDPMQAAYVPRAGAAPIVFRLSIAGLGRLQDQIFPQQAKGGGGFTKALIGGALGILPGVIGGSKRGDSSRPQSPNDQPNGQPGTP